MVILEHFGEDAFGRDGHGHASKSKEKFCELLGRYHIQHKPSVHHS
jgi:hypothetical protein